MQIRHFLAIFVKTAPFWQGIWIPIVWYKLLVPENRQGKEQVVFSGLSGPRPKRLLAPSLVDFRGKQKKQEFRQSESQAGDKNLVYQKHGLCDPELGSAPPRTPFGPEGPGRPCAGRGRS